MITPSLLQPRSTSGTLTTTRRPATATTAPRFGIHIGHLSAEVVCGYGQCSVSGCNCPGYSGNANLCGNCGHNYTAHW